MADAETCRDWQLRTDETRRILTDKNLEPWQKAHMAGGAYAGLTLSGLRQRHRQRFLTRMSKLNAILVKYQLESFDDYQNISSSDLQKMITIIRTLARTKK